MSILGRSPMSHEPSLPVPEREHWPLAVALVALLAGAGLLGVALSGAFSHGGKLPAPPAVPAAIVITPAPAP
ncbi:MAG: lytic transglycosylase protein, partial [Conexibacter sp.]|nr:lytic transglycosylase protein [Conexibacter sp.]